MATAFKWFCKTVSLSGSLFRVTMKAKRSDGEKLCSPALNRIRFTLLHSKSCIVAQRRGGDHEHRNLPARSHHCITGLSANQTRRDASLTGGSVSGWRSGLLYRATLVDHCLGRN